jgi:hypothetical protein
MKKTITFLFLLCINHFAFSQWSTNPAINNAICTDYYNQNDIQIIPDGNGGAIISWYDYRLQPSYSVFSKKLIQPA